MLKKLILICVYVIFLQFSGVFAQQTSTNDIVDYSGTWASNYLDQTSTDYATFLHIEKIENNRYLVVSYSNESNWFTYVGGGFIREDGFLQVTTDKGAVHLFFEYIVRGHNEALGLTDPERIETFGPYIRIDKKFTKWPFPEGDGAK
ncbi:MAG: hypothetical protein JEY91_19410 [Spirochaetaceae bacterium]|nr:hypothetical protein [Spirochaetaceae bacterium]